MTAGLGLVGRSGKMRQAEGWLTATSGSTVCSQPCLQQDESTARGVGVGGSSMGERRAHSCQQGRKSRYSSVRSKERFNFLMLQMYCDKRIIPRSVLFILCL